MRTGLFRVLGMVATLAAAALVACAPAEVEEEGDEGAAAASEEPGPELAQMNDVSILFPLAKTRAAFDRGYLSPTSPARGGELLPKAIYERAFGPPGTLLVGGTPAAPLLSGLKLVSIRLDPCFAQIGPIASEGACKNQLRLIFQTMTFGSSSATAADDGVHVFYSLTRDELKRAVTTMIDLRRAAAGEKRLGALGPHPLLKKAGGDLDVETAAKVGELVRSLAGPSNLIQITQFAPSGLDTTWNFSAFDVEKNETKSIPTLSAGDDQHVAFFAGFTPNELEGDPAFVPVSRAPAADNMQALGNRLTAAAASADVRKRAFGAMLRLEDPNVHSPETIDCASCHAVEPVRKLVGKKHFASDMASTAGAFRPNARFVPAADMEPIAQAESGVNVHMFSYKGTVPSVHRRMINETAAVVAHVNERVLSR
jgi:hypothetical protein